MKILTWLHQPSNSSFCMTHDFNFVCPQVYNFHRRDSPLAGFDLYGSLTETWDANSSANTRGVDFQLFSNYSDFTLGVNPWLSCSAAITGQGYPGR